MEIKLERNKELLEQLEGPKKVWELFLAMTEIPRGSGNCEGIRKAIIQYAETIGVDYEVDDIGNVLIRKPGTRSFKKKPSICFQSHMDIVCTKTQDHEHDFLNDPLHVLLDEEKWMTADKTTLGGDNGIGMALSLALLTEDFGDIGHGPFEVLCTVDEETTMGGAFNVKRNWIKSKYLINVDSEDDGVITIGSAGGGERTLKLPIQTEPITEEEKILEVNLKGLKGGHSGVDIHCGHANAIRWLIRLLLSSECKIVNIFGGNAKNAIPSSATAIITTLNPEEFKKNLYEMHELVMKEYRSIENKGVELSINESTPVDSSLTNESSLALLDFTLMVPHGVLRMHPEVPNLVEASQNEAIVKITEEGYYEILIFMRSSSISQSNLADQRMKAICRLANAEFEADPSSDFPSWEPQLSNNPLLDIVQKAFIEVEHKEPIIESIHAGLEVSIIQSFYKNMMGVSIGPTIQNPHSTDERMLTTTIAPQYEILKKILMLMATST